MLEIANKTVFPFEGKSAAFAIDATGDLYTTPDIFKETLGDLARLTYVEASARYRLRLDASSAAGTATLKFYSGAVEIGSADIDLTAGTEFSGVIALDMSSVLGGSLISAVVNATVAGSAGRTAELTAHMVVEHPIVLGLQ